jgi:hypothetical protein
MMLRCAVQIEAAETASGKDVFAFGTLSHRSRSIDPAQQTFPEQARNGMPDNKCNSGSLRVSPRSQPARHNFSPSKLLIVNLMEYALSHLISILMDMQFVS